jgi:hypothetical protein
LTARRTFVHCVKSLQHSARWRRQKSESQQKRHNDRPPTR